MDNLTIHQQKNLLLQRLVCPIYQEQTAQQHQLMSLPAILHRLKRNRQLTILHRFQFESIAHQSLRNVHIPKSISDFEQARLHRLDRVYVLVAKGKSPLRFLLPLLWQHESHPVKVAPSSAFPDHHHKVGHPRFYACRM